MTLDKFNKHLHQGEHSKILIVENLSALHCDIMFYMGAFNTDKFKYYQLLNGVKDSRTAYVFYVFPLESAVIKHTQWTPAAAKIHINGALIDNNLLIGRTLKKGDQISVLHKPSVSELFVFEAVLSVPVVRDTL